VSDDGKHVPVGIKEGDKVVIPDYGGKTLNMDGKE